MRRRFLHVKTLAIASLSTLPAQSWAVVSCPGGGVCPDHNTCCPTPHGHSSCISGKAKPDHLGPSYCCRDEEREGTTGCGPGYLCGASLNPADGTDRLFCVLRDHIEDEPKLLPRYKLCAVENDALELMHGLEVHKTQGLSSPLLLAYYSTMHSLDSCNKDVVKKHAHVRIALVVIHGSGRNADDYLCCATSSLPVDIDPNSVLVIAPRFLAVEDGPVNITAGVEQSKQVLRWNETHPIPHTWRYGADAIDFNVSSYDAVDSLLERLVLDKERFPLLEKVIVAGHSAGGQFTQRWALTSSSLAWGDDVADATKEVVPIRVVVANPRSFCYLDKRRYVSGSYVSPSSDAISACPGYNQWEWGLGSGGRLPTPYKDRALVKVGGQEKMVERYKSRDVVYLAGELDVEHVHSECEDDDFQGKTRLERSERFFASLEKISGHKVHERLVASGVPHDHCLMFQSIAGHKALFGEPNTSPRFEPLLS